jgi:hypothetical protein
MPVRMDDILSGNATWAAVARGELEEGTVTRTVTRSLSREGGTKSRRVPARA